MESHGKMNRKVRNERVLGYGRSKGPGILHVSRVEVFNAGAIDWNAWHHVALVYDPLSGLDGVWTFFVDAKSIGTVANRSRPDDASLMVPRDLAIAGGYDGRNDGWRTPFRRLTAPFTGVIDDWKFTRKALTVQKLDWVPPTGCVMIVR